MAETRLHCDVLVAGAGPAGIAAAIAARRAGKQVVVVDDNPHPGGQIWRGSMSGAHSTSAAARKWLQRFRASGAELLSSTRIVTAPGANTVLAEHEGNAIHIHYDALVLATGARELLLPFPGWTLPGVMGAGGLQAMAKAGLPLRGKRVVVAGTGPLLLAVAAAFVHEGATVPGVFDQASRENITAFAASLLTRPSLLMQGAGYLATIKSWRYRQGWWPLCVHGEATLQSVVMTNGSDTVEIACDYLACGFHLVPNIELGALLHCRIQNGAIIANEHQQTSVANVFTAGEAAGIAGLPQALVEGEIAGAYAAGAGNQVRHLLRRRTALRKVAARMNHAYRLRPELRALPQADTLICRCEDVSWQQLQGFSGMRSAKIHTRCGMGPCQGRICGAAMQFLAGWEADTHRPPLYPVQLSTLLPLAAHDTTHLEESI